MAVDEQGRVLVWTGDAGAVTPPSLPASDRSPHLVTRAGHTTPEMAARVVQALDARLTLALHVAEATTSAEPNSSDQVF